MLRKDRKLLRKQLNRVEKNKYLAWVSLFLFVLSSCSDEDKLLPTYNDLVIKESETFDIRVTKVYDRGLLIYEKVQRDSLIQVFTYDPIFSRITARYDYSSSLPNSFYTETASRFKMDVEGGKLLLNTYCIGCHFKGDISGRGLKENSIEEFTRCFEHSEILKYRFDSNDLQNIFLADSIAM